MLKLSSFEERLYDSRAAGSSLLKSLKTTGGPISIRTTRPKGQSKIIAAKVAKDAKLWGKPISVRPLPSVSPLGI
jgi:hypothetical protein